MNLYVAELGETDPPLFRCGEIGLKYGEAISIVAESALRAMRTAIEYRIKNAGAYGEHVEVLSVKFVDKVVLDFTEGT